MKILLLGSGGREHAFAWKMSQSPTCEELFIAPGNAGTAALGTNVPLAPNDFEAVGDWIEQTGINMLVVGPEEPLVRGIYDFFQQDRFSNLAVIGPSKAAAQLEGSKGFAKAFMDEFSIPTAAYQEFNSDQLEEGLAYIATQTAPIVLKADGLAAGKGVLICQSIGEAQAELKEMLGGKFGAASSKVVIEEFLDGIEFSVFVATDSKDYVVLPVAKDYKRIGEGDTGLNTGGMGSISPVSFVDDMLMRKVEERIIKPTVEGIKSRSLTYKGFIFIGLMNVDGNPQVIEYNVRMGDPETEVVLPRIESDLLDLFEGVANQTLHEKSFSINPKTATTVMLVSGGYPEAYEKGKVMIGFDDVTDSIVYHAGTTIKDNQVVTSGGRVMAITSFGNTIQEALNTSYSSIDKIHFEKMNYRKDIGFDLI